MPHKQRRERGSTLEPQQRDYIEEKLHEEGLSIKAAAVKYQIAEATLRNALNGKDQDYTTLEDIIDKLHVPDVNRLMERHRRRFNLPRERNLYFTGREDRMRALAEALERTRFAAVTQALSGLGGVGKTSTAIEYAYRCLDRADDHDFPRYKAIQFARADTVEVLKSGYAHIAQALQLPRADPNNLEEGVQAVLRWMMRPEEAPWLLILDNADEPDLLTPFLPREPQRHYGHVLITSRSHRFAHRIQRVDIDMLAEEEGVTFLYRRTGRERIVGSKEEQAARDLVLELGELPLALEQAAAYMIHGQEMSFGDYLLQFRDERARSEQMRYAPEYGDYRQFEPQTHGYTETLTVQTTWQVSLSAIEPEHPEAVELLRLCAFLHPVGIPRELVVALLPDYFGVAGADGVKQSALYNGLLNVLTGYSLIRRDLNNSTHSVHILLQTVLRDGMSLEEQRAAYKRILTAIAGSFPSADWGPGGRGALYYPHAERLRSYVEQTGMEGEQVARLLQHIGRFLSWQGRLPEAEPHLMQSLAIRQKVLTADHPDIAASLNDLAWLYWSQGRYAEGEPLAEQSLAIRQKVLDKDHPDIAKSLLILAELCSSQGRFAEAKSLFQQALALRQQALPEGHPDIAESLNFVAAVYHGQGDIAEAESLYQQALAMRRKALPEDHASIAESLNNLAFVYQEQGRFAEAEPLYQQATVIWQEACSKDHPVIAFSLNNLARLYQAQGRFGEAELLFLQALKLRQNALAEGHPYIATSLSNLAGLYRDQGRFGEAEPLLLQAIKIWENALPKHHPLIAKAFHSLARLYQDQGRFSEAEPLFLEALAIRRKAWPAGHPTIVESLNDLAELYRSQGRAAEAEALVREASAMEQNRNAGSDSSGRSEDR